MKEIENWPCVVERKGSISNEIIHLQVSKILWNQWVWNKRLDYFILFFLFLLKLFEMNKMKKQNKYKAKCITYTLYLKTILQILIAHTHTCTHPHTVWGFRIHYQYTQLLKLLSPTIRGLDAIHGHGKSIQLKGPFLKM